jgi:hypothetical protein
MLLGSSATERFATALHLTMARLELMRFRSTLKRTPMKLESRSGGHEVLVIECPNEMGRKQSATDLDYRLANLKLSSNHFRGVARAFGGSDLGSFEVCVGAKVDI